jgi:hypothetical protein
MADQDPKRRRWLVESSELDELLGLAELDTPPPGLEARLLQRLREAQLLEPRSSAADAGEPLVDPPVTAAEPAHISTADGSGHRAKPVWVAAISTLLAAAAGALLWWGQLPDPSAGADAMLNEERHSVGSRWYGAAEPSSALACAGTYLIRESQGSLNLWTFHLDGTLISTSLGERAGNFSTQHGSWKAVGPLSVRAVQLDFRWASDGSFDSVRRVDITIRGKNGGCDAVVGELSGRVFEAGEDFRKLDTASAKPFSDTFTGSRVEVSPE